MPRKTRRISAADWIMKLDLEKLSEKQRMKVIMRALLGALDNESISVNDAKEVLGLVV